MAPAPFIIGALVEFLRFTNWGLMVAKAKTAINPFYVLLVVVGIVFFVTAFAYGVMAFRADRLGRVAQADQARVGLMAFLDEHGGQLLTWELLALGLATGAAIGSDSYWTRRQEREQAEV